MVIEKVHGLHSTGLSLSERFTLQASASPVRIAARRKSRRNSAILNQNNISSLMNQTHAKNQHFINQIAKRLEQQSKRKQLRQRLGVPQRGALRRVGSENSLPGLCRSNSFHQLPTFQNRVNWRGSNGNLSRSASFSNLPQVSRGQQRHGFRRRAPAGRFRGVMEGRVTRSQTANRGRARGGGRGRGGAQGGGGRGRGGWGRGRGGGAGGRGGGMRGRGRGGMRRQLRSSNPVPSKEELDNQLDEYMASSKSVLDRELDAYMKTAMEMEP